MKSKNTLIVGVVIIIVAGFLIQLFNTSIPYALLFRPQAGKLNFQALPEKTLAKEGEVFDIYLILTNVGDEKVNVWKLEEQISYDISFFERNGSEVPYRCGVISRAQLRNDALVELSPGRSLIAIRDSSCWNLSRGEYILRATYHTKLGERITKPYWVGNIESSNVTLFIE